jgi:hypothetical protein
VEIGRSGKYFNLREKPEAIDNLNMYRGFRSNFVQLEKCLYLRVDSAKKIVQNTLVLDVINDVVRKNKSMEKEERRLEIEKSLIGQVIMTNYGKCQFYKILGINFEQASSIRITEKNINLIEYYDEKYNIKIQKEKQPLLIVESRAMKRQTKGTGNS